MNEDVILDLEEAGENPANENTFNAPYVAGFSERVAKDLKSVKVVVTFCKGQTLYNSFWKLKLPSSQDMNKNVINCLECKSCPHLSLPSKKLSNDFLVNHVGISIIMQSKKNPSQMVKLAQHVVKTKHMGDWDSIFFLVLNLIGEEQK